VGFELKIRAKERPQAYALDRAAFETDIILCHFLEIHKTSCIIQLRNTQYILEYVFRLLDVQFGKIDPK